MSENKLSPKTILLIAVAGIVFIIAMFYVLENSRRSRAALGADGVKVTFTPSSGTFAPNTDQTMTIKLEPVTATYNITGINLYLNAGGNTQFVSATTPTGFNTDLIHSVSPTQIRMAQVDTAGSGVPTVQFTVTYHGTGPGPGTITLDTAKSEATGTLASLNFIFDTAPIQASYTFGTGGGNPTATTAPGNPTATTAPLPTVTLPPNPTATLPPNPTATLPPTGGNGSTPVTLKLKFQGIPTKPANTSAETVQVRVAAAGQAPSAPVSGSFSPDASGVYTGTVTLPVAQGSGYTIYVKGPRHLQKKICTASPTETAIGTYRCTKGEITLGGSNSFDFSKVLLLVGDLPQQDGVVDAYDTSFIRQNFGSTDPAKLAIGDLNRDGIIDTQDMSLIIQSLNIKYDEQ